VTTDRIPADRTASPTSHRAVPACLAGLLALLALLPLAGCGGGPERPWNVVFILVDTLRADHLSAYGHDRPTSPELDRLAEGSYLFENALAQAGCTFPSVNSLLTSRHSQHFLGQPEERRMSIPDDLPTLAEILSEAGYATAAVSASSVVRATPSRVNHFGGFGQGFDAFDEECLMADAACVNARAFEILDGLEAPYFLYLHYWDPHDPYRPPLHHVRSFPDHDTSHGFLARGNLWPIIRMLYQDGPHWDLGPEDVAQIKTLYDEEIRYFDGRLRELLDRLETRGDLDRTLLVFASDHGDEHLEHGHIAHCRSLAYQTVVHTPLLLKIPGLPGGRRDARVQNLDVTPTILDYLGIPFDDLGFEGRSLRPVIESEREVHRYVFASQGRSRVVSDGRYKLIHDIRTGERALYDLAADPGETEDLATARPEETDRLEEVLFGWIRSLEGAVGSDESLRRADEAERQLKAVGYL
jgi:arylsulfatase A-like enzyme